MFCSCSKLLGCIRSGKIAISQQHLKYIFLEEWAGAIQRTEKTPNTENHAPTAFSDVAAGDCSRRILSKWTLYSPLLARNTDFTRLIDTSAIAVPSLASLCVTFSLRADWCSVTCLLLQCDQRHDLSVHRHGLSLRADWYSVTCLLLRCLQGEECTACAVCCLPWSPCCHIQFLLCQSQRDGVRLEHSNSLLEATSNARLQDVWQYQASNMHHAPKAFLDVAAWECSGRIPSKWTKCCLRTQYLVMVNVYPTPTAQLVYVFPGLQIQQKRILPSPHWEDDFTSAPHFMCFFVVWNS